MTLSAKNKIRLIILNKKHRDALVFIGGFGGCFGKHDFGGET